MSTSKLTTYIQNNKDQIRRKALIFAGVGVGLALSSGITEKLTRPRVTNITIINEIPDEIVDPSSEPLEP